MSRTEFAVEILDDFGFDEREVLTRLFFDIEVAVAFDPRARKHPDVRGFDERATRLPGQKNAFYRHCTPDDVSRRCFNTSWPAGETEIVAPAPALCSWTM
jgi:hypothetical protein